MIAFSWNETVDIYIVLSMNFLVQSPLFKMSFPSSRGNDFVIDNLILQCVKCLHRTLLVVDDFLLSIKDSCRLVCGGPKGTYKWLI